MRRPDFSPGSLHRCSASQRSADALLAELTQPSLLLRHIALCRLLHAGDYPLLGPAVLRQVAARLGLVGTAASAVALLERVALLREAELSCTPGRNGVTSDSVEVLRSTAIAELAGHGYRTVHGAWPSGRGR